MVPCSRCHRYPDADEAPFQHCARCKSRHYCSKECQSNDWKLHKTECRSLTKGETVPDRTPLAASENVGSDTPAAPDADTIFYLKTSKPHLKDVSISGPYYPLDATIEQIRSRLVQDKSVYGMSTFEELLRDVSIDGVTKVQAPLPDGDVMTLEICREKNAWVAAFLRGCQPNTPRPVYIVLQVIPHPDFVEGRMGDGINSEFVPVVDSDIIATFTSKDAANHAARNLLETWKRETACQGDIVPQPSGLIAGFIATPDGLPQKIVEVRFEDGKRTFADGSTRY
ncbi:hypothetical protein BCR34DRAFT_600737 [Clohesyomyces aquaticus]|uniref:MYND-type domain-containing protein n=1 Tax=Clohesyomyces aquaticus TaxID=1231657 RepID=A0A1Y1ZQ28_9PLEO|nr:hypothetical protein BCR34DRAFT_600737 [Clohesyomyces aquaticus]